MPGRCRLLAALAGALLAVAPAPAQALTLLPAHGLPPTFAAPTLQLGPSGEAWLVGFDGVFSAAPFGGAPGEPQPLLGAESGRPWQAVSGSSAAGELVVVYTRLATRPRVHRRVRVVVRAADGTLSAPRTISQAGRSADSPAVAVGPAGEALAAWVRHDADARWHVQYAVRHAGEPFGPAHTVPAADGLIRRAGTLRVAVAPGGGGLLTWTTRPPAIGARGRLMALGIGADGAPGAATVLEDPAAADVYGIPHGDAALAYGPDGRGILAWIHARAGATQAFAGEQLVAAPLDGATVGGRQVVDTAGGPIIGWGVAAGAGGAAVAAWASYPKTDADVPGGSTATTWTATRTAGRWGAPQAVSHPGIHVTPGALGHSGVVVAENAAGDAVAAWGEQSRYVGGDEHLWVAARRAGEPSWSPAADASGELPRALSPQIRLTDGGQLAVAWERMPGPASPGGAALAFGSL